MDRYTAYMKGQLKELLTRYGPIGILWFDGEWEKPWTHERGVDLYNYVRSLQPNIIINNRVGKGRAGMAGMDKGNGARRRLRHARAGDPAHRLWAGRGLGIVHDDEQPLGLQQERPELEIRHDADPQPDRLRQQGRQLPAQRRPHGRRRVPGGLHRAPGGDRRMDEGQQRVHLRHPGQPVREARPGAAARRSKLAGGKTRLYLHVYDWPADGQLVLPGPGQQAAERISAGRRQSARS